MLGISSFLFRFTVRRSVNVSLTPENLFLKRMAGTCGLVFLLGVFSPALSSLAASPKALTATLCDRDEGCFKITLEDDGQVNAGAWRLYAVPKLYSLFHDVLPDEKYEYPCESGKFFSPDEVGDGVTKDGKTVWHFPVKDAKDFYRVWVVRAMRGTEGTAPVEVSVARLAKSAGNSELLAKAAAAYWAQGTEPLSVNEKHRVGNERVYRMKETGTEVFEVDLPAVTPLEKRVRILAWGDNHFKLANDRDLANENIVAAFKARGAANPPEKISQSAQREVEMAPFFDETVVLGDNIDFFSHGSLELWRQMVLDPLGRDFLAVIGAHDMRTDFINGRPYMEMPPEKTIPIVKDYIPNDVLYHSKLIGGRVLCVCIQSDWGWFVSYWNVAAKLKADLERARKNGWTVLLFGHDGYYPNTWTKGAEGKYDREADKEMCTAHGFYGDRKESYVNRGDYLTGSKDRGEHIRLGTKAFYDVLYTGADVIRGIFQGHVHANYCMRIHAKRPDGKAVNIPQYSCHGSAFRTNGFVFVINVK